MPVSLGDRRFPAISKIYEDARGYEPREISEAPIQMVHEVNAGSNDLVMARAYYDPGGGSFPLLFTAVTWTFGSGAYEDTTTLPDDRIWRIIDCGAAATAAAPDVAIEYTGHGGVSGWSSLANHNRYHGNVSAGPYPDAIEEMSGLILPYGGILWVKRGGGVDTGRLAAHAVGWIRGMTPPF